MSKKAIIFGVNGQDGSHLADLLLSMHYEVVGVSRRSSTDNSERIVHLTHNPSFSVVCGDITDQVSVNNILRDNSDVDEVYNLAAQSHVGVSFKQPGITWDITGKGCINILQAIVDLNLGCRFYQASSSEMFGKNYDERRVLPTSNEERLANAGMPTFEKYQDENTKFLPQSPYAIAKTAAHYATRLYREAYGLHASSGILFNHEGPRRGEEFVTRKITKWIGEFAEWRSGEFHTDGRIELPGVETEDIFLGTPCDPSKSTTFPKLRLGNLQASRDWGYAGDYVEAMWSMLQQDKPDDYVICTGETHTIEDFLSSAFSNIGIKNWRDYVVVDPEFYRPAEVDYLRGDCSKAKEKLGWHPAHSFEDLVKMMVEADIDEAKKAKGCS